MKIARLRGRLLLAYSVFVCSAGFSTRFRVTVFNTNSVGMAAAIKTLHQKVKAKSTDCIVFPETFVTDTVDVDKKLEDVDKIQEAENTGRKQLIEACMELGADCLVCGRDYQDNGWYNTAWYVDRHGKVLYKYDKQAILSSEADPRYQESGDPHLAQLKGAKPAKPTFSIPCPGEDKGTITAGVLICADLEQKDILNFALTGKPAVIFNPASLMPYSASDAKYMEKSTESAKLAIISRLAPALEHAYIVRTDFPWPSGGMSSMVLKPVILKPGVPLADAIIKEAWPGTFAKEWIKTVTLDLGSVDSKAKQ